MKNVKIEPRCISCGSCQYLTLESFEATDVSYVKADVDLNRFTSSIILTVGTVPSTSY